MLGLVGNSVFDIKLWTGEEKKDEIGNKTKWFLSVSFTMFGKLTA